VRLKNLKFDVFSYSDGWVQINVFPRGNNNGTVFVYNRQLATPADIAKDIQDVFGVSLTGNDIINILKSGRKLNYPYPFNV